VPGRLIDGFRLAVNIRGERGHMPHVHVTKSGTRCKIALSNTLTPYGNIGMSDRDIRKAQELIAAHFVYFINLWNRYNA
jgi:hypothetical protein